MVDDDIRAQLTSEAALRWVTRSTDETEPPERLRRRIGVLHDFLDAIGSDPDSLVAFCFLRKKETGERFLSTKRRTVVNEQIEAFVQQQGWTGKDAVANGNIVRSFLIHNGVPIGGRAWAGD